MHAHKTSRPVYVQMPGIKQDKNFTVRLQAAVERKAKEFGILEKLLKASKRWEDYDRQVHLFTSSLKDITLNYLQGIK